LGNKQRKIGKPQSNIGFNQMLRDVLIASMNKGQFPLALSALIFVVLILKMPQQDVSTLVFRLLDAAEAKKLLGWILAVIMVAIWYLHTRSLRRWCAAELERVSGERNSLQRKTLGNGLVKSSGR
jgi:hypothetical protein